MNIKKLLLGTVASVAVFAGPALAADMPVKAPPPALAPVATWTGWYAGISGGHGWSNSGVDTVGIPTSCNPIVGGCSPAPGPIAVASALNVPASLGANPKGGIFGGQIGYNQQFGRWLAGAEADLSWTGIKGSATATVTTPIVGFAANSLTGTGTAGEKLRYFGTVRGRLGWLPADPLLLYVTGGLAYGEINSSFNLVQRINGPCGGSCVVTPANGSASGTRVGWTVGGGAEWMFAPHWSLKGEYLFYDLGSVIYGSTITANTGPLPFWTAAFTSTAANFRGSIARAGLNYKF
jgi:outer membrane immunogenic protein